MKQLLKGVLLLCAAAALTACGAKSEAASSSCVFRGDSFAGACIF